MDINSDDNNEELGYDPANIGAMIVLVLFSLAILFWLFWSLLVFKGGILTKLWMLIQVIIREKSFTAIDPELWDGWVINVGALGFLLLIVIGILFIFRNRERKN